jgi:hypothetical protein
MPWCTEPEIDEERQQALVERADIHDPDRITGRGCLPCGLAAPMTERLVRRCWAHPLPFCRRLGCAHLGGRLGTAGASPLTENIVWSSLRSAVLLWSRLGVNRAETERQ